jgi:predicted phage terminase large subunit-like protein
VCEIVAKAAIGGFPAGWFAPNYKYLDEPWRELNRILKPVITKSNASDKVIELITGGRIDFWTLEDQDAGRSRKYKAVVVDEAAMVPALREIWRQAIRPTLADYRGEAWFLSSPKGIGNPFHEFFEQGKSDEYPDWASWIMPTATNPHIKPEEIEAARKDLEAFPLIFQQEWLGEFIKDSGEFIKRAYFNIESSAYPRLTKWVRVWDFAVTAKETGDWTAGALVGIGPDQRFHIRNIVRFRKEWPEAAKEIARITAEDVELAKREGYEYEVGAESVGPIKGLIDVLIQEPIFRDRKARLYPIKVNGLGDKKQKASGWVAHAARGLVTLWQTGWDIEAFLSECVAFTGDKKDTDDQIDAVSLGWILFWGHKASQMRNHEFKSPYLERV